MNTQKAKRVTIADVSEASGMSKASVSMILNNKPGTRLSEETAERVRAVAKELGYRPNAAAQSLRSGKTRTLGFISDQVTVTRFASEMITGILRAAEGREHTVLIAETFGKPDQLAEAVTQMAHRDVDGLILGFMDSRQRDLKIPHTGLPTVLVNGIDERPCISVLPNEFESGKTAVQRIVASGAHAVAIIGQLNHVAKRPRFYPSITRRFASLFETLEESSLELFGHWTLDDWNPTDGYTATTQMLSEAGLPDAIICANDRVAMGVFQALAEKQLIPGKDLSVLSFDDEIIASYLRPQLSSIRLPYQEMGALAVELLLDGKLEPGEHQIDMPLIERDSMKTH
ncbi:LacI family DNA-binding transcriptional regulator [Glutamicibacter sp. JC586]|uniref:LacI family DNA-binding transcriptional regulator n=1 Tax=Glutamicibacter sp. JC586 TaxID=2590552 RepID=UPI00135A09BF|nr:LacI family DNA-binding transcriptional regulator [Glutamicibacter sp. JC586]